MTNIDLKAQIDAAVTNKVAEESITPTDVGNNMDAIVDYVDQQDLLAVHLSGNETIAGLKVFTSPIEVMDGVIVTNAAGPYLLKADGTLDSTTYADDFTVVHKDGSETIIGTKTFITDAGGSTLRVQNTTVSQNGIEIDNTNIGGGLFVFNADNGAGIIVDNDLGGVGISIDNNSFLEGIYLTNNGIGDGLSITNLLGRGIFVSNTGSTNGVEINTLDGNALKILGEANGTAVNIINNGGTAKGIVIDNSNTNTGIPFSVRKNAVDKVTIDDSGVINAISFVKTGGTSAQFLMADGSVNSSTYINDSDVVKLSADSIKNSKLTLFPASGDALISTSVDGIGVYAQSSSASNPALTAINASTGDIAQFFNASLLEVASVRQDGKYEGLGFVKTGGLSTEFLMADGSVSVGGGIDTTAVHKTGSETIIGQKTFNTPTGQDSIIINNSVGNRGIVINHSAPSQYGLYITSSGVNSAGIIVEQTSANSKGSEFYNNSNSKDTIFIDHSSIGSGIKMNNNESGNAINISNNSDGSGIFMNAFGPSILMELKASSSSSTLMFAIMNHANSFGISVVNNSSSNNAFEAYQAGLGSGFWCENTGSGTCFTSSVLQNGVGMIIDHGPSSNGLSLIVRDNGVDKLNIRKTGHINAVQYNLTALNTAPLTAASSGTLGEIRIDANHIYICVANNTWKRVAIATF